MSSLSETVVEDAALSWFKDLNYAVAHAPHLAPGEIASERSSFGDIVLSGRLRNAIARLNPAIPSDARDDAVRKVLRHDAPSLIGNNRAFHRTLRDGVPV
jgi:type I restriction enzyme, R subunit